MPANMIINTARVVSYNNNKAGRKQRAKHRHKKIGAEADGRRALKNKPPKQPPFKPGSQSHNGCSRPEASQKNAKACAF